uniref:Transcriptional regulator n=1 Tax=Caenorhabditis tropicalis TaxID=1561998 RepID=A0A1I7T0F5_9PELO
MDVEGLTEVEKEILKLVPDKYRGLFSASIRAKNPGFLLAVDDVKVHDFQYPAGMNLIEPLKGHITMKDVSGITRDQMIEHFHPTCLNQGGVAFGLGYIVEDQAYKGRMQTLCFGLNTCDILNDDVDKNGFEKLEENFNMLINQTDVDIFSKNYLIFPAIHQLQSYCILIINPLGAVVTKRSRKQPPPATMICYATTSSYSYENYIAPRIMKLLEMFVDHYGGRYKSISRQNITSTYKEFANKKGYDKPFQMLHVVQKLLDFATLTNNTDEFKKEIENVEQDYIPDMETVCYDGMTMFRFTIARAVRAAIMRGTSEIGKYLYQKRFLHSGKLNAEMKIKQEKERQYAEERANRAKKPKIIVVEEIL